MADILYIYGGKVYLNITNQCPCACTFCIRNTNEGVGSADTLWHDEDPSLEAIKAAIDAHDFSGYTDEVVFCGYGEPTCALDNLVAACKYVQDKGLKVRINTNGQSDLIHGRPTAKEICAHADTISISLNAPDRDAYQAVTRSKFGPAAYDAMLAFAQDCKACGAHVVLSVVDTIGEAAIEQSRKVAESVGIPLRVREYTP